MICTMYSSAFELVDVRYRIMSPVPSIWRENPATKNHLSVRSRAARRDAPMPTKTPAALGQVVMLVAVLVDFCACQRCSSRLQRTHARSDDQERVQVLANDPSRHGREQGDQDTTDDRLSAQQGEWQQRVWRPNSLPDDKSHDGDSADHELGDRVCVGPSSGSRVGGGDGDEEQAKANDEQDQPNEVELPKDGLETDPGAVRAAGEVKRVVAELHVDPALLNGCSTFTSSTEHIDGLGSLDRPGAGTQSSLLGGLQPGPLMDIRSRAPPDRRDDGCGDDGNEDREHACGQLDSQHRESTYRNPIARGRPFPVRSRSKRTQSDRQQSN